MHHRRITATGSSYARGESIGKRWHNSIITILKSIETAALAKDGMTLQDWLPHARGLLPFIQEYAPISLEEMKGMAAGSDMSLDNILLLACAYEKWFDYHTPEHCTAFAVMGGASKTMVRIPARAITIAAQVSCRTFSFKKTMPRNAATKGAVASMNREFATVVKVIDQINPIKAVTSPQAPSSPEAPLCLKLVIRVLPSLTMR